LRLISPDLTSKVRFFAAAIAAALLFCPSSPARAQGAVLHPKNESDPTTLDAEMAVASTPYGNTRWARIHVAGPSRVLWVVPARPGAAIDLASHAWLDALDESSALRIQPPNDSPPCGYTNATERVATWGSDAARRDAGEIAVHTTEADLDAHADALGFAIPPETASAIAAVFASGSAVVSIAIDVPSGTTVSSPTVRVSDDGSGVLPLALFGSNRTIARISAIAIAPIPVTLPGGHDVYTSSLSWGTASSSYTATRSASLIAGAGSVWIRESSLHAALFDGIPLPRGATSPALVDLYGATCAPTARDAATKNGLVGRACAAGAVARVPGGGCAPVSAAIDPAAFTCNGADDLALALAGSSPQAVVVSRLAGIVPSGGIGASATFVSGPVSSLLAQARSYDTCPVPPPKGSGASSSSTSSTGGTSTPPPEDPPPDPDPSPAVVIVSDGCFGETTTTTEEDGSSTTTDDGCGSSETSSSESSSSSDSCSSSNDKKTDDGEDSSSSKKSDDSCSGSSSAAPKTASLHTKHRSRSPFSRIAIAAAFIVLPLRRRSRPRI
jgi:hypothetical protein